MSVGTAESDLIRRSKHSAPATGGVSYRSHRQSVIMIVATHAHAAISAAPHLSNPRLARLAEEHTKLYRNVDNYLASHPALVSLGPDPLVQQLVASKGLAAQDVVVVRALAGNRFITVICLPTRVWRDEYGKAALLEVKKEALSMRSHCILVPQRWVKAPIRAAISRTIAISRRVHYGNRQLAAVLKHVRATKITTLAEAARHVPDHDDPIGVVLLLCGQGVLTIDRSGPIGPDAWVAWRG